MSPETSNPGLTQDEIGDYLASIGNHEGKAITLLAMRPGVSYGGVALHEKFLDLQDSPPAFVGTKVLQHNYCRDSFEPIGAVARVLAARTVQYELDPHRGPIGQGIAGHLLRLSENSGNISLGNIFSVTASTTGEIRPPLRRAEIARQIVAAEGPLTLTALARQLPGRQFKNIEWHVRRMAKDGLLDSEEQKNGPTARFAYSAPKLPIPDFAAAKGEAPLTQEVVHLLNNSRLPTPFRQSDLEGLVLQNERFASRHSLKRGIAIVMQSLVSQGVVTKDDLRATSISASDSQQELFKEMLAIIDGAQAGGRSFFQEGREYGSHLLADPQRVNALVGKAYNSRFVNRNSREEIAVAIQNFLASEGTAYTRDIAEALAEDGFSDISVRQTLRLMAAQGSAVSTRSGAHNIWQLDKKI